MKKTYKWQNGKIIDITKHPAVGWYCYEIVAYPISLLFQNEYVHISKEVEEKIIKRFSGFDGKD